MSKPAVFKLVELTAAQRSALLERIRGAIRPEDYDLVAGLSVGVPHLLGLIEDKDMTIGRLRNMVFGAKTEQSARLLAPPAPPAPDPADARPKPKRKGHGRKGTQAYPGARRVTTAHPELRAGRPCPHCPTGKLYPLPPARLLRIVAEPMFQATLHELERLRCGLCGAVFTAPAPPELARGKYDPSVGIMLAIMRYGAGQPLYRTAKCQEWFGVPLPASVQWELIDAAAPAPEAVYDALIGVAAQAPLLHNDDTTMRVQSLRQQDTAAPRADGRTGIFTSNILAQAEAQPIALFFTGGRHAGENLDQLLQRRAAGLTPPLQMCDALARNQPEESPTDQCFCLVHGRRNFVELLASFPVAGRKVIESLREVYRWEARARADRLSDPQRLALHQTHSGPVMAELRSWMQAQLDERKVEPNSSLGKASNYMLNHWAPLTRFLEVPGAPLDNNICERALKTAILHRKNSLSYKTERGARVGDVFMSLVHTCQLGGINPFNYLTALCQNAGEVLLQPTRWLPWNYPQPETAADTG
jgi:transposase